MLTDSPVPNAVRNGMLLFLLGVFLFSLNDALGKWLLAGTTAQQLLFIRSLGAAAVLIPLGWRNPANLRLRDQWGLHALRIACMTADSFSFYFASQSLPLADVMTFYLASPLIITALSVPFLGERVDAFRWVAVLVGFAGVLVALRPSSGALSGPALIALGGSCTFACAIIVTRKLRDTHWVGLIFWQFLGSGLVGLAASPIGWITPTAWGVAGMCVVGILSMACFIAITNALRLTDASIVAPFQYTSIAWAVALGWLIWGDLPDRSTVAGIAIIIGSGLAVWWRTQRSAPSVAAAVPVP